MRLTHLDLFSGYGGFSLASEIAGFETVGFSEIDPYVSAVLAHRYPNVPNFGAVQSVTRDRILGELGYIPTLVTGGFPCQPHSTAGKRGSVNDERDLWPECARVLRDLRPVFAIFENTPGLYTSDSFAPSGELARGLFFNRVLSDLAEIGYAVQWEALSADEVGAPHERDRIWILCVDALAYRHGARLGAIGRSEQGRHNDRDDADRCGDARSSEEKIVADGSSRGLGEFGRAREPRRLGHVDLGGAATGERIEEVVDAESRGTRRSAGEVLGEDGRSSAQQSRVADESGEDGREAPVADDNGARSATRIPRSIDGEERNSGVVDHDRGEGRGIEVADADDSGRAHRAGEHSGRGASSEARLDRVGGPSSLPWPSRFGLWPAPPGTPQHEWEPSRLVVSDSTSPRREGREDAGASGSTASGGSRRSESLRGDRGERLVNAGDEQRERSLGESRGIAEPTDASAGEVEPIVGRDTDGPSDRMDAVADEVREAASETLWRTPTAEEAGNKLETLFTKEGAPARPGERAYRRNPDGSLALQLQTVGQQVLMVESGGIADPRDAINRTNRLKATGNGVVPAVVYVFIAAIHNIIRLRGLPCQQP